MSTNDLKVLSLVTKNAAVYLHNNLSGIKCMDNQYDSQFRAGGQQGGGSLQVRLPSQYTVSTSAALSVQNIDEDTVTMTRAERAQVSVALTSEELLNYIDNDAQVNNNIIKPIMATMASKISSTVFTGVYSGIYQQAGTAGTAPASADPVLEAAQYLNESAAPDDGERYLILNPRSQRSLVNGLNGLYNPTAKISEQYIKGYMIDALGFKIYMDQTVPSHTNGLQAGTPLVKGASQTGSELVTDGWTASTTITAGTVIYLDPSAVSGTSAVYSVNAETKVATSTKQKFVVTEAATASGAGEATLKISPSIITSGATQTVSASPVDNAAIVIAGDAGKTYGLNMAFHRQAIAFVTGDLPTDLPGVMARREVMDGISLRALRTYDAQNDRVILRFDVCYGYKLIRPQLAVRLIGA